MIITLILTFSKIKKTILRLTNKSDNNYHLIIS